MKQAILCPFFAFFLTSATAFGVFANDSPEFSFISDFVESLACQKEALQKHIAIAPPRQDSEKEMKNLPSFMKNMRAAHADLLQAKGLIEKHKGSGSDTVKKVAPSIASLYEKQVQLSTRGLKLYEKVYNQEFMEGLDDFSQGKLMSDARKITAERQNLNRNLADLSILVTHVLYSDRLDKEGKMSYLTVTSAERKKLLARLNELFAEGQGTPLEACAGQIRDVLTSNYKSCDEE